MSFEDCLVIPTLATFLTEHQNRLTKSDEQMAEALGFSRASIYTLIKEGKMKMPTSKVPLIARALDVPAQDVLTVLLTEYDPELLAVINKAWGPTQLTAGEKKLLSAYRTLAKGHDVEPLIMDGRNIVALITT
jgi:predicted DNA-binding transcriptional regulator AlpA